ncbi:MAG TPA: glycogen debranching N-terminal domain-containing protein [Actinomycetota bacterium]|nr:glycogen debranching N-terminal domain-containing protein [Actinomycetota bacterium]
MPEAGISGVGADAAWIQVLEGSTFMLSDERGDVRSDSVGGLFHEDTRYLSRFSLTVDGASPVLLSSGSVDHDAAAFFLTNPELPAAAPGTLSIQRYRFVGDGLVEVLLVQSHLDRPVRLEVRLSTDADFADLFQVKGKAVQDRGDLTVAPDAEACAVVFDYRHRAFKAGTRVHATEPGRVERGDLVFDVDLGPRATWKTRIQVSVRHGDDLLEPISEEERAASRALQRWRQPSAVLERWNRQAPALECEWDLVGLVYQQALADLAALRLHADVEGNEFSLPAAGLPWFMAIFGRDTLITSYQALPVGPELARGALNALAGMQGRTVDDFSEEEPGKILHEVRFGELTVTGVTPHRPYYGTADATPLWLILLSEYWRWTGDDRTALALEHHARWALAWIDTYGDPDGDGFVEYRARSAEGLRNQGWKDSPGAVAFADGSVAEPPIALCEVQGYVHDAKVRMAEVAERVWGDGETAARLRDEAGRLFDRFNDAFWLDRRGGYYALALDADKRPVDAMTSNMGHLLWSGLVPRERAEALVRQLLGPAMFSGWGVRTMSADDVPYNPIAYHNGTVWPHDNSLIAAGLQRYGFREEANRIAVAMFEAASFTGFRLPEVFAGYPRSDSRFPVRYPTASSPQAWATAAPFLWLRLILGLEPRDGRLRADPLVPRRFGRLALRGVHAFGRRADVEAAAGEAAAG